MNRPTLATFRAQWPAEAMGVCMADPAVAAYCNDAQERLMMDPLCPEEGWWGGWVTMNLTATVTNGASYVTTPREIARLVVMAVCQQPVSIRNGFYEYLNFGSGTQPKTCQNLNCSQFQAFKRDNVPILGTLLSTPQIIRVYPTDSRDAALRVLVQGKDQNDAIILNTDPGTGVSGLGEYLQLAFPFVDSTNQFSTISGIQKDQTYGPLQFFQVDPTTGEEVALTAMEPGESSGNYRRYLINGIPSSNLCCTAGTVQLTAQGRLDFIPVQNEVDFLTIPNVPALIEEAMSIRYGKMDSSGAQNQSLMHHAKALALLNGQLDAYQGKTSTAIKMPIFGSQRMQRQPV